MTEYIQVFSSVVNLETAEKIGESVIEKKLAAIVQITGPVKSMYMWNGRLLKGEDWRIVMKTTREQYQKLEAEIKRLHPYGVPEILAMPVLEGNRDYLNWINKELG
ncbi:MAG: divalent-cation tolerance protein CutA [Desulfatiglans sp.]|jgi:periplasmic divalent cation tolerance protein|nr:divalent-cation tolerance protein CutA [Desulfatiglans sp.]